MRRPRFKCVLCGKKRVASPGVSSKKYAVGHIINIEVTWSIPQWVCRECNDKIGELLLSGLWGEQI